MLGSRVNGRECNDGEREISLINVGTGMVSYNVMEEVRWCMMFNRDGPERFWFLFSGSGFLICAWFPIHPELRYKD
jgi:hypothetical protein